MSIWNYITCEVRDNNEYKSRTCRFTSFYNREIPVAKGWPQFQKALEGNAQ
ncbi:hypothetical protein BT69DRAFT_1279258, partial [Atractiella rhizophila]